MTYRDACAILAIREDAPPEVAEAAFRTLSKKAHPDTGGSNDLMTALNTAIEVFRKGAPKAVPDYRYSFAVEPEDFQFRYGKHAGEWMSEVPLSYLRWWGQNQWWVNGRQMPNDNEHMRELAREWLDWRSRS